MADSGEPVRHNVRGSLLAVGRLKAVRMEPDRRPIHRVPDTPCRSRGMARPLQYSAAPFVPTISTSRTGGHPVVVKDSGLLSPVRPRLGTEARHALRLKPDHPMGAGQPHSSLGNFTPQEFAMKSSLEMQTAQSHKPTDEFSQTLAGSRVSGHNI